MLFRREEIIIRSGDLNNSVFYLSQGYIRACTVSKEGNELTLHIFGAPSVFPILWDTNSEFSEHCFESLTPAEVYRGARDKLKELIDKDPDVSSEIIKQLHTFAQSVVKKLESKIFYVAYQQVAAAILDLAQFFSSKNTSSVTISYWFTHQDLANITGLARETVSLEISKLLRNKLIYFDNHFIVIPRIENLKKELHKD